jgi:hypothetical protein
VLGSIPGEVEERCGAGRVRVGRGVVAGLGWVGNGISRAVMWVAGCGVVAIGFRHRAGQRVRAL